MYGEQDGDIIAQAPGFASAAQCCTACKGNANCNTWNFCYCNRGCGAYPKGTCQLKNQTNPFYPRRAPGAPASRTGACHVPSWREGKLGRAWQCPQLAGVPACACVAGKCGARAIPTRHALLAAHASYARSKQSPCWCWSVCAASGAYEWGGAHASVRRRRRANP